MKVYLFTDASFDHLRKRAGWAIWVEVDGDAQRGFRDSGVFPRTIEDSGQAELLAVCLGIERVLQTLRLGAGDELVVQADNDYAIEAIAGRRAVRSRRMADQALVSFTRGLVTFAGIAMDTMHVKGHQQRHSLRAAINIWCDQAARTALAMEIAEGTLRQRHRLQHSARAAAFA